MARTRVLEFALDELDRLATANDQIGVQLPRLRNAATDPVLEEALSEQIDVNMHLHGELGLVYAELIRERTEAFDPLVLQFCRQAEQAMRIDDIVLRDMHIARTTIGLDQWQLAVFIGLSSVFRQLYQDPVADSLDRCVAQLQRVSLRIEQVRPSLTQLFQDEKRHGHQTRSPEERDIPHQLQGYAMAGPNRRR